MILSRTCSILRAQSRSSSQEILNTFLLSSIVKNDRKLIILIRVFLSRNTRCHLTFTLLEIEIANSQLHTSVPLVNSLSWRMLAFCSVNDFSFAVLHKTVQRIWN